jgi:hypothetical protein
MIAVIPERRPVTEAISGLIERVTSQNTKADAVSCRITK